MKHTHTSRCAWVAAAAGALALGACQGDRSNDAPHQFFPDLDDAPKWNPQTHSEFFSDGRAMRVPDSRAVAFGRHTFDADAPANAAWSSNFKQEGNDLLKENATLYTGKDGADWVLQAPIAFSAADLARGQERFNIYCAPCHGYEGDGQGMVGRQWATPVPSYHDPKYADANQPQGRDGYIFSTARNGVAGGSAEKPDWVNTKMPGYKHALSVEDTWRIVAYIRSLQASRLGTLSDVPDAQRDAVRKQAADLGTGSAPAAPTPAPVPATTPASGGSK